MNKMQAQVQEFHEKFQRHVAKHAEMPPLATMGRRIALIAEELGELSSAVLRDDFVECCDALGDILYVVFGSAVEMGVDIEVVFDEIHRANMSKLARNGQPIITAGGKVVKGPDYRPPDIAGLVGRGQVSV